MTVEAESYSLWVDAKSTVLVRLWNDGTMEVATRPNPESTWGSPINMWRRPPL